MRKLFIALILVLAGSLTGCYGLGETQAEHNRRLRLIGYVQSRQFVDDLDFVLLTDRNSELTQWHPRVGR